MIIREIFVLQVSSDPERAVKQINQFLATHPAFGLINYEIAPGTRALFGRYEKLQAA